MTNEEFIKNVSFEGEEWKDVVGFEGLYMVSSFGRVISLYRIIDSGTGGCKDLSPSVKALRITNSGYFQVNLWKNNKGLNHYVHKLVAESFIPNPNDYLYVDHIDTNRINNNINNLKWCTNSMNVLNPITRKRRHESVKKDPKNHRWIIRPVVRINISDKTDIKYYESVVSTSKDGYNPTSISAVCRGNRGSYKGYRWYYQEDYETLISTSKNDVCQSSE